MHAPFTRTLFIVTRGAEFYWDRIMVRADLFTLGWRKDFEHELD